MPTAYEPKRDRPPRPADREAPATQVDTPGAVSQQNRGKGSGAEAESSAGWVVDIREGKALRVTEYLDRNEALEAAGLTE